MMKCDRCHEVFKNIELGVVYQHAKNRRLHLCESCYNFIRDRFDDVIDEYILRKD